MEKVIKFYQKYFEKYNTLREIYQDDYNNALKTFKYEIENNS